MKIVSVGDTHGYHHHLKDDFAVPDGDVFIHTGDITMFGESKILFDFNDWLATLPHKYKIVIAGNHDRVSSKILSKHITNGIYLENQGVELENVKFWGSPFTPAIGEFNTIWAFSPRRGLEMKKIWDKIPRDTNVLITHGPPFGVLDKTVNGFNVGCEMLAGQVLLTRQEYHLQCHLFGHIHEGHGLYRDERGLLYANCSVLNENYNLKFRPTVINI